MKLYHKLFLGFLILALSIWVMGQYAMTLSKDVFQDNLIESTESLALEMLNNIYMHIENDIGVFHDYTHDVFLRESVLISNYEFEKLPDVRSYLAKMEKEWTSAEKGELTPLMNDLMSNRLSGKLDIKLYLHKDNIDHLGAAMITNKYGASIAQTIRTDHYRHDDNKWWQIAKNSGLFIGDLRLNSTTGLYDMDLAISIEDEDGVFIGVVKVVINIEEVARNVVKVMKHPNRKGNKNIAFKLLSVQNELIYSSLQRDELYNEGNALSSTDINTIKEISPITYEQDGILSTFVYSEGPNELEGLKLILVLENRVADIFAHVDNLKDHILIVSVAVSIFGLIVGLVVSLPLARNVNKLRDAAIKVGRGDLKTKVDIRSNDELGELGGAFQTMINDLKRTTVNRDELAIEVMERQRAETELEAKNAELERFTYTVSHDLKSPLITIKGFLGIMEKDIEDNNAKNVKDDMSRISGAVEKMKQMLDELLELSRIGRLINPSEHVSLSELVQEAVEMVSGVLNDRRIAVQTAPDMPLVNVDVIRFREVLENLITNAAKSMGEQSDPKIDIGFERKDTMVVLYVRDNGIGIDPKYHNKIFGLFDKLDQSTEGSGIGLAIVKRIVEMHGGRIWVESDGEGQGSTFFVSIPNTDIDIKKEELENERRTIEHIAGGGQSRPC